MSKLSYKIKRALEHLDSDEPKVLRIIRAVKYFFMDIYYDYPYHWVFLIRTYVKNFIFFLPHIINMRNWDSSYQITLFCDSLKYLADGLKGGNALLSEKQYRRCLTASEMLRRAYNFERHIDKSYTNWSKRNFSYFKRLDNRLSQLCYNRVDSEDYANKMFKLINKRLDKTEKKMKADAWTYIHRHIEEWWD